MPIYEYQCKTCKRTQEMFLNVSNKIEVICSNCVKPMTKIISKSTFILKGTGWYATDKNPKTKVGENYVTD